MQLLSAVPRTKKTSVSYYVSEIISIAYYIPIDLVLRELQDFALREIARLSHSGSSSMQYKVHSSA